ncbi:hypothetical protein MTO96_051188 [Rhipicephalus appendiculatus]
MDRTNYRCPPFTRVKMKRRMSSVVVPPSHHLLFLKETGRRPCSRLPIQTFRGHSANRMNFVSLEPVEKVKRYDRKAKVHVDVPRPAIFAVYNSFMGGTDQRNYQVALYKDNVRSRRW